MVKDINHQPPDDQRIYEILRNKPRRYTSDEITLLLGSINISRVFEIASILSQYIRLNLPKSISARKGLTGYRTNPYVMMASAYVLKLTDPVLFARFLFDNKFYMGLETSFGKSIEKITVSQYPVIVDGEKWQNPPEKAQESVSLSGLSKEKKARARILSVWREIDRSLVIGKRRFLVTIKSGPNTINDTQVEAMRSAIIKYAGEWMAQTQKTYPDVTELDIVIGLTYGTEKTTNNKENQLLVKLLDNGFIEEDRVSKPGILIDSVTKKIRVYRIIGKEFWAFIGNPLQPENAQYVYLEVLFALSKALNMGTEPIVLEESLNEKIRMLSQAFYDVVLPYRSVPETIRQAFTEDHLFWITAAMTAFYDHGI
jgi:hypothetical protein